MANIAELDYMPFFCRGPEPDNPTVKNKIQVQIQLTVGRNDQPRRIACDFLVPNETAPRCSVLSRLGISSEIDSKQHELTGIFFGEAVYSQDPTLNFYKHLPTPQSNIVNINSETLPICRLVDQCMI